jgi:hypothetical protein
MIPKKTEWCQSCVEDGELTLYTSSKGRTHWLCEECISRQKEAERRPKQGMQPSKKFMAEMEAADRRCAERMQSRSTGRRVVGQGESLPGARTDFGYGAVPMRSKSTPMDTYVGFLWSYGWGPNEEE